MTSLASGDFVIYKVSDADDAPESVGMVLRTSANDKADGSKDEYAEVVPLPNVVVVRDSDCRKFDAPKEEDPNKVTGSSASDVAGVKTNPKSKASS